MTKNIGQIHTANPKTIPLDTDVHHGFRPTEPVDTLKDFGITHANLLAAERARLDALESTPLTGYKYHPLDPVTYSTTSLNTFVAPSGVPTVTVIAGNTGKIVVQGAVQLRNNSLGDSTVVTVSDGSSPSYHANNKSSEVVAAHHAAHQANNTETKPLSGVLEGYTPGETVTLTLVIMTDSGGQAEMKNCFLSAWPLYEAV